MCEGITCAAIELANGTVSLTSAGMRYPLTATFSCHPGYRLVGAVSLDCSVDGSWSGSAPVCQAVTCAALASVAHGSVEATNGGTYPSTATYSCEPGYSFSSSSTASSRVCQPDGSWSGVAPTCSGVTCAPLGTLAIDHGEVATTNSGVYPSTATYTCSAGYELVGSSARSCQTDGSWGGTAPSCRGECGLLIGGRSAISILAIDRSILAIDRCAIYSIWNMVVLRLPWQLGSGGVCGIE